MNKDMPTMLAASSASQAYGGGNFNSPLPSTSQINAMGMARRIKVSSLDNYGDDQLPNRFEAFNNLQQAQKSKIEGTLMSTRRVIQVFIADPNENVPLDDCLLYKGPVKVTDATDQELFFELDIKELLAKHNVKRTMLVDKKVKDRTENLEPAKVRDLKMVVVTVATL